MTSWGDNEGSAGAEPTPDAPGWDAIAAAARVRGLSEPLHFGTTNLPDQDGAYGLNAHPVDCGWLLMTLGLTELFGKVSDDPDISGWGFELTMRVPRSESDTSPPAWAMNLLLKLSQYVFSQSVPFADGHRMSPGGPITGADDTILTAVAFTADPELLPVLTSNGSVEFLTVVGITAAELALMQQSSTATVLAGLPTSSPPLLTDPARR